MGVRCEAARSADKGGDMDKASKAFITDIALCYMTDEHKQIYQKTCPTCGMQAGFYCMSATGRINKQPHATRKKDAKPKTT